MSKTPILYVYLKSLEHFLYRSLEIFDMYKVLSFAFIEYGGLRFEGLAFCLGEVKYLIIIRRKQQACSQYSQRILYFSWWSVASFKPCA